jgi:hypothetical protein
VRLAPVASPTGFFIESKPKLGGTTDADSIRPIWDERCFYFPHHFDTPYGRSVPPALSQGRGCKRRRYVYHRFSSSMKDISIFD